MKEANFKETEIGKIPVDWEVRTLGEFCSTFSGGTPDSKNLNYYNGDINWISSGELNQRIITKTNGFVSQMGIDNSASKIVDKNTFLLAMYGATAGISAITKISGAINQAVLAIVNDRKVSNNYFLLNFFELKKDWIIDTYTQGGQPNLNADIVKKISIPLPPLPEQEKIAELLSDTDLWIESTEALLAKKRKIKKGAMQKMLSPKEDWEVRKLGEVGEIITGGTPSTLNKEFWNGNIAWITPTDISNTSKNIFKGERSISEIGYKQIRQLPKNSLLVTCIASIGKNAILRAKGACNQQINAIIPNEGNNVDFIYYLIELNKSVLMGKAGTTATLMLSKAEFSLIEFSFPPLKTQQEIAEILSSIDLEIESLENRLQKTRQLKQGMMQDLLTGKVRLG